MHDAKILNIEGIVLIPGMHFDHCWCSGTSGSYMAVGNNRPAALGHWLPSSLDKLVVVNTRFAIAERVVGSL